MKTTIQYNRHDEDEDSAEFYHPDYPVLYKQHDTIGRLEDCPFPLVTDLFKVLLFGDTKPDGKFAVVEYTKSCGHAVQERIPFFENVQDFDHYGTKFIGADYSIKNWQQRIEFFRTILPCDVCQMVRHSLWCQERSDTRTSEKKRIKRLLLLLDYNFRNWREMTDLMGNPIL